MLIMVVKAFKLKFIPALSLSLLFASFFVHNASAASVSLSITCDKSTFSSVNTDQSTCSVQAASSASVSYINAAISTNGLSVVSISGASGITSTSDSSHLIVSVPNKTGSFEVATIVVKSTKAGENNTIQLINPVATISGESPTSISNSNTASIYTKSNETKLSALSVSNGNIDPGFNPDVTAYNVQNTSSNQITINATAKSNKASISGNGTKSLSCGQNNFPIKVTAENGNTKTYTVGVYRNCNTDNSLKSVQLSTGSISFKPSTTTYYISVGNEVSKFTITGALNNQKSTIKYSPSQTINLAVGKNTQKINVTSESGVTRTYTFYITRAGDAGKSSNANLSSLTSTSGSINFNKDVYDYKITVPYETKNVSVTAVAEDQKATVSISELPELKVGDNLVSIIVTAENGANQTYKLTISRQEENAAKLDNDSSLVGLVINDQYIDIDSSQTSFDITIDNVIEKVNVVAMPSKVTSKAEVISSGDTIGDKDTVQIIVTAEDGSTTTYILNFSFPYETATIQVEETKPINYLFIIIVAVISLGLIGLFVYLYIVNKNKKKPIQNPTNTQQNPGRWYNK